MFPNEFSKIISHYAQNNGTAPLLFSDILELVGSENYDSNISFIKDSSLGKIEELTKENCPQCGASATVKNIEEGIIVCERSHRSQIDPLSLKQTTIDKKELVKILYNSLQENVNELSPFTDTEYTPYHFCGFDPVGVLQTDEIKILILSSFKNLKIRDAAVLQGLITTSIFDYFILLIEGIDKNAEEFLSYNTGATIHYVTFDKILGQTADISQLFKNVTTSINMHALSLHAFLKHNLVNVQKITNPEVFKTLLEYDATLIDRSVKAATSGSSAEFEDIVGNLLGSFLPVTNLGHTISTLTDGKKTEVPDGIIEIPDTNELELMFYDCKSVGKTGNEKEIKNISQPDEDQFERYCELFTSPKLKAKLSRGIFIANDFSPINLANKSLQIRNKSGVPSNLQIVYFPLKSLIKLYSRLTQERTKFMMHFEPNTISKLFGQGLDSKDEKKLESDKDFEIFNTIRKSNTNSVYVIESLVDVLFDYVYSLVARNQSYLPYIIDISKRQSSRY